jgi:Mrp family chromosome partitioning ATPase
MSKNFELLQNLQKQLDPAPIAKTVGISTAAHKSHDSSRRIVRFDPNSSTPEVLLELVETVFLSRGSLSPRLVAFAGIDSGENCTRMVAEVAQTLARSIAGKVCLVDAYFHSPSLSEFLGLGNPCGLTEASHIGGPIFNYTISVRDGKLVLLPWGLCSAGQTRHLALDKVKEWLDELRLEFEYVLVNAPPLDQFADGIALGQLADGMIPVLDRKPTEAVIALEQLARLRQSQVRICGAVFSYTHFSKAEADATRHLLTEGLEEAANSRGGQASLAARPDNQG